MHLYGIYGSHTLDSCPIYHKESAEMLIKAFDKDEETLKTEYKIYKIIGQYYSAFEHTFVWIVDAEDPHLIEKFAYDTGLTKFNTMKIVPMKELEEEIIPKLKDIHQL